MKKKYVVEIDHIIFTNYTHLPFVEWMQKRKRRLESFLENT